MNGGDGCTTNVNVLKCHLKMVVMVNLMLYVFPPNIQTHACVQLSFWSVVPCPTGVSPSSSPASNVCDCQLSHSLHHWACCQAFGFRQHDSWKMVARCSLNLHSFYEWGWEFSHGLIWGLVSFCLLWRGWSHSLLFPSLVVNLNLPMRILHINMLGFSLWPELWIFSLISYYMATKKFISI